jgi:cation transport regulator ChaB
MPYASNADLPKAVKNTLPDEAQTIWRKIADSAIAEYGDEKRAFATAWAGLRRAGWKNESGKWSKVEKESPSASSVHVNRPLGEKDDTDNSVGNVSMGCGVKKEFVFKIAKADDEKRLAFGWSVISRTADGTEVWDLQNDAIDPEDLEALAYKYVRFYRDSGELHNGSKGKGVLIESVVTTLEKQQIWRVPSGVMPVGWWTGFYVTDDDVWEKVKSGEYAAFSIEGTAVREKVI